MKICTRCNKPIINEKGRMHALCRYHQKKCLALYGMIPPDRWIFCDMCKEFYPFWNFLSNSCSKITGSNCDRIKPGKKREKVKKINRGRKRPQECLKMPRCEHYVTCLGVEFRNYQKGCYEAPTPLKIDIRVFKIMAVK